MSSRRVIALESLTVSARLLAVGAFWVALVASIPATHATRQFPADGQFVPIQLGYSVSDWFPADIDGDGTWELAIRLAGPPVSVGIFNPRQGTWVDGPRELATVGTQWGAGDWNGDGALEYAYRSDSSVRHFDTRTLQDAVLWTVDFPPQDVVVWGQDRQGNPLVGLREAEVVTTIHVDSMSDGGSTREESHTWHVYRLLTGERIGRLPGGLGNVRRLYGFPTPEATCLAVYESSTWFRHVVMEGEEGHYAQLLRLVVDGWSVVSCAVLPHLNERMEMIRSLWGLHHAALGPMNDATQHGVIWYVRSMSIVGTPAPQCLGASSASGSRLWADQVRDCQSCVDDYVLYAGIGFHDVTGDGESDLILPLMSGEGWEIRNPGTGLITDTLRGMPLADLRVGALRTPGKPDLFYVSGDVLYVWDDGDVIDEVVPAPAGRLPTLRAIPNPFNAAVTLKWSTRSAPRALEIHNILGQGVRVFDLAGRDPSGHLTWDGRDQTGRSLASGVYFARLVSASESTVIKLVLLK